VDCEGINIFNFGESKKLHKKEMVCYKRTHEKMIPNEELQATGNALSISKVFLVATVVVFF